MTLRAKTLLTISSLFLGLIFALSAISNRIVLDGFTEQEKLDSIRDVERVVKAIKDELGTLRGLTRDWAWWDDTVSFVQGRNDNYEQSNLAAETVHANNRLSLLLFIDNKGDVVYGRAYDYRAGKELPGYDSLLSQITDGSPLVTHRDPLQTMSGLLITPDLGPLLICSAAILTSDAEGEPAGTLIMGRILAIEDLADRTLYSLTAFAFNDPSMPADFREALEIIGGSGNPHTRPLNERTVAGYGVINDIYGNPALVLRAAKERTIYARGQETIRYFVLALVAAGVVCGLAMLFLIERLVLRRLRRIGAGVSGIAATGDTRIRLDPVGGDELASLATQINHMLDALHRSRQEKQEVEVRFRAVFEGALDALALVDEAGKLVEANPPARQLLGLDEGEPDIARNEALAYSLRAALTGTKSWADFIAQGSIRSQTTICPPNADPRAIEYYCKSHVLPGLHLVAMRDITSKKRLENKLQHQAFHDALTGLPNRAHFMRSLGDALADSRAAGSKIALLFMDLDDFKVINDTLGHKMGDQLLVQVGHRLSTCVRPCDLVARLGGDEFTLLLRDIVGPGDAEQVADRVVEQMKKPIMLGGQEVFVTTSIGIALGSGGTTTPDDILRDADMAMYEAKKRGKGRFAAFEQEMNERAWRRLQAEMSLRHALEHNEFRLHFQPVYDLRSGEIVEVETLVRWQDPEQGLVHPADFIPMAEESGLIVPLGRWILDEACRQFIDWQRRLGAQAPARISVNLSVRQFREPSLLEDLMHTLGKYGMQPGQMTLEITETLALDSVESTLAAMDRLDKAGFQIAMDDFGTGYSALGYLKRFPIHSIKIDRVFVAGLDNNPQDTAIVHAMVAFARTMHLNVTAEGIETEAQAERLRELGCDWGQGYYFSRPAPAEVIEALLRGTPADALATAYDGPLSTSTSLLTTTSALSRPLR